MTEVENKKKQLQIIRDPSKAKSRIYVGNLPICTREELESICLPYGKVFGSLVQKNFGFVQFESEEIANKVANSLSKSTFKGNVITVRNAGSNKSQSIKWDQASVTRSLVKSIDPDYNDCEIIVINRNNTKYAEMIESRLSSLGLRVDVLFPNDDVPLGKVLGNISSRGCLYAVLVTQQHEELNSITVNILYGQPAEHRNMPTDDAIKLIHDDFQRKISRDGPLVPFQRESQPVSSISTTTISRLNERHPEAIQILLNSLANNMSLTALQYECVIKYLDEKKQLQTNFELGDAMNVPDPEIGLQKQILEILSKPSVAESHVPLAYPTIEAIKNDTRLIELLRDVRIQKAFDSLLNSNLVSKIADIMKF